MARRVAVAKNPKTVGDAMRRAAEGLGPTLFCSDCYGWANTWHVCSFPMGRAFLPTTAVLEGGLAAEDLDEMEVPREQTPRARLRAFMAEEVAS